MNQHLNVSDYEVRTDLALEAHEMVSEKEETEKTEVEGVVIKEQEVEGIQVTYITINEEGEARIGKKAGRYITLFAEGINEKDTAMQETVSKVFSQEMRQLFNDLQITDEMSCLVVGLGNWNVTPDALGPFTVERLLITKHLFHIEPKSVEEGYRSVSALSPGVMGITGLETSDIISGVINETKPDFIIAIDALAARSIERVNTTIQIADTGIHPGSGVGNNRKELSQERLGIPVIAIGVPTVVDAVSIVSDTIDYMLSHVENEAIESKRPSRALVPSWMKFGQVKARKVKPTEENQKLYLGLLGGLSDEEKRQFIGEVLTPLGKNLMVTPKEVDTFIEDMAHVLASGLNAAFHQNIGADESGFYTH